MDRSRGIDGIEEWVSSSEEETIAFGKKLASSCSGNTIFCFFGDLGAGKTTLIKGIAAGLGIDPAEVSSPTFIYLNIYATSGAPLYHFDLYRLKHERDFLQMGFEEYLYHDGVVCIEWSERISKMIPPDAKNIHLKCAPQGKRNILIT